MKVILTILTTVAPTLCLSPLANLFRTKGALMRRLSCCIFIALYASILVCICSAQQTAGKFSTSSDRQASPAPPPGPILGGDGTTNFIPIWTTPSYLLSSSIYQASGGSIGIGTTTPAAKLDVSGGVNAAQTYQIGGSSVLGIGNSSDGNLFLGVGAGSANVAGSGIFNTFSGYQAGYSNTTGELNTFYGLFAGRNNVTGSYNTISGSAAGEGNTGSRNTFYGYEAGYVTSADDNVFVGYQAGYSNLDGMQNAFFGSGAGFANNGGFGNTFSGYQAGYSNNNGENNSFFGFLAGHSTAGGFQNSYFGGSAGINATGSDNTMAGFQAGADNLSGNSNSFFGFQAGYSNPSGNNDIYIGNLGASSGESNTIRLGGDVGTGFGAQTATYIVGIYGVNVGGVPVQINSAGRLGAQTSSLRFKEQVRDMGDSTSALMNLRPVTFLYKPEYANGDRTLQYGLIAEEVAKVYPELVAYDNEGQPYTVRYQYIATMLLNEVQKQYRRAETQAEVIEAQEEKIDDLEQRLMRLERIVSNEVQSVAQK